MENRQIERVKELCKEKGVSVTFICDKLGKTRSYISDLMRMGKGLREDQLPIVADILGTSVEYLRGETDEKESRPVEERLKSFVAQHPDMEEFLAAFEQMPPEKRKMIIDIAKTFAEK